MAQRHTPLQPHEALESSEGCHKARQPHLNPADILPPEQPADLLEDTALPVSGVMEAFQKALDWQQQQKQQQEDEQQPEKEQAPPAPGQEQQAKQSSNQEPSVTIQPTAKAVPQAASNNGPAEVRGGS